MPFDENCWREIIPPEKFPTEFEKVAKRDKELGPLNEAKFKRFDSEEDDNGILFLDPRYMSTDDIIYNLTFVFPRTVLDANEQFQEFQKTESYYWFELGKLMQGWSDEAIRAVADSFGRESYPPDNLFNSLKNWREKYKERIK